MRVWIVLLALTASAWAEGSAPWLGVQLKPGAKGAQVQSVLEGSPAKAAGIVVGDELTAIDEEPIATPEALVGAVKKMSVGHVAKVKITNAEGQRTVSVKLEAKPDMGVVQRNQLIGNPAPDFEPVVLAGGKLGKISSLKGQVVLLDFFATWCGPCVASMPHLRAMQEKYGARGLKVLGVSSELKTIVQGSVKKFHLNYPVAVDDEEAVAARYHVFALPTMIVIDRTGIVREVSIADPDPIDAAIAAALKQK